jgi:sugar phosphate isomerase/epimerase
MADRLRSPFAGVVVDAYHVWWDPEVMNEIERARGKIVGFHVSDWPVPLPGILMGRAMMGDGVIDLRQLRHAVEKAGYDGPIEVEIFNEDVWKSADDRLLERIQRCFVEYV